MNGYKERDDDKLEGKIKEGISVFFNSNDYKKIINLFKSAYSEVFENIYFAKVCLSSDTQGNNDFAEIELQNENEEVVKTLDFNIGPISVESNEDKNSLLKEIFGYIESQGFYCENLDISNIEICY